jgi:hypothetical protein
MADPLRGGGEAADLAPGVAPVRPVPTRAEPVEGTPYPARPSLSALLGLGPAAPGLLGSLDE